MNEKYDDVEWLDIPDYERWQASIYGTVRNKKTKHVLKPVIDKDGYERVSLGNRDNLVVHRLICSTFYGKPKGKRNQVNHIDCNRSNNRPINLQWVTPQENIAYGYHHGNVDPLKGMRVAREVNKKPVRIVETGQVFDSLKSCAEYFGVPLTNIARVITGCRKGQRFHGYHLEHVEAS